MTFLYTRMVLADFFALTCVHVDVFAYLRGGVADMWLPDAAIIANGI